MRDADTQPFALPSSSSAEPRPEDRATRSISKEEIRALVRTSRGDRSEYATTKIAHETMAAVIEQDRRQRAADAWANAAENDDRATIVFKRSEPQPKASSKPRKSALVLEGALDPGALAEGTQRLELPSAAQPVSLSGGTVRARRWLGLDGRSLRVALAGVVAGSAAAALFVTLL